METVIPVIGIVVLVIFLIAKTAVIVPHAKDKRLGPDPFFMPETEVEHLDLPLGCDWLITTPLTISVEDGIVTCAEEGSHTECMGLE